LAVSLYSCCSQSAMLAVAPRRASSSVPPSPIAISASAVSTRGPFRCLPCTTSTLTVTSIDVSSASPFSSPSPCRACASPKYSSAPGFETGRYTVAPSPISLKSIFPPYRPSSPVGGGACGGPTAVATHPSIGRTGIEKSFICSPGVSTEAVPFTLSSFHRTVLPASLNRTAISLSVARSTTASSLIAQSRDGGAVQGRGQ